MNSLLAVVIGVLYASGIHLLVRRSLVKLILGIVLLGHATHLLIFTVGRANREQAYVSPPLIAPPATVLAGDVADPLPQALILTAIVIGFGVVAFTLVLIRETVRITGINDVSQLQTAEENENA